MDEIKHPCQACNFVQSEMTLRDYFAAQAIVGIVAHPDGPAGMWHKCAVQAYEVADAMLAVRKSQDSK